MSPGARFRVIAFTIGFAAGTVLAALLQGCTYLQQGEELRFQVPIYTFKDEYVIYPQAGHCLWKAGITNCPKILPSEHYIVIGGKEVPIALLRKIENGVVSTSSVSTEMVQYDPQKNDCKAITPPGYTCSPNFVLKMDAPIPNDPLYKELWGLERIRVRGAWNITYGSGAYVYVVDSGVNRHLELVNNIEEELSYDAIQNKAGPGEGVDDNGHGSHVGGTIAAKHNNGIGVTGVCPGCRIIPIKFLQANGSGSLYNAVRAIDYVTRTARERGIQSPILNASWGGGGYSQPMFHAISEFCNAGGVFVAAAGNEGLDNDIYPSYPSGYPLSCIISVGALDRNNKLAPFSNYGKNTVHIAAPGVSILSTSYAGAGYATMSGSSMASPHVAGVAGLLASKGYKATDIRRRLLDGSVRTAKLRIQKNRSLRAKKAFRVKAN